MDDAGRFEGVRDRPLTKTATLGVELLISSRPVHAAAAGDGRFDEKADTEDHQLCKDCHEESTPEAYQARHFG